MLRGRRHELDFFSVMDENGKKFDLRGNMTQEKLLMIPGPTPVHPRIITTLALPTISHVSPEFVAEMKEALANLKKIVFCKDGEPFLIAGAGTLAMEMALLNTVGRGEKVLILSQGYFGQRMAEIARVFGLDGRVLEAGEGQAVLPEVLARALSETDYAAVVATHVDTATGVCAPVREYAEITREKPPLFILDGVCATGGIEENMEAWGLDVVLTAAQKCFGVPPGLAVLVFSSRAIETRKKRDTVPGYYADLLKWLPIMHDPSLYFSTPCVNEIRAFCESTRIILEEGLEARFARHARLARAVRKALEELGFSLAPEEPYLADTLSVVRYPEGIDDAEFRKTLADRGVVVAGGLGNLKGRVFRMGHMGNLSTSQVYFAIEALEQILSSLGYPFEREAGLRAAQSVLEES